MRVLILALLAGCYDPGVDDCQFRCGQGDACPDGTECDSDNFCRVPGMTGRCGAINDPCSGAPPSPMGCASRFALPSGACGVICTQDEPWTEIMSRCGPMWQPGVLPTDADRAAADVDERTWVGASRPANLASFEWSDMRPVDDNAFSGGAGPLPTGANCAYLDTDDRLHNDRPCSDRQQYICTSL